MDKEIKLSRLLASDTINVSQMMHEWAHLKHVMECQAIEWTGRMKEHADRIERLERYPDRIEQLEELVKRTMVHEEQVIKLEEQVDRLIDTVQQLVTHIKYNS